MFIEPVTTWDAEYRTGRGMTSRAGSCSTEIYPILNCTEKSDPRSIPEWSHQNLAIGDMNALQTLPLAGGSSEGIIASPTLHSDTALSIPHSEPIGHSNSILTQYVLLWHPLHNFHVVRLSWQAVRLPLPQNMVAFKLSKCIQKRLEFLGVQMITSDNATKTEVYCSTGSGIKKLLDNAEDSFTFARKYTVECFHVDTFQSGRRIKGMKQVWRDGNVKNGLLELSSYLRTDEERARIGEAGDPREDPPTSGIIRHDSHMSDPVGNRTRIVLARDKHSSHYATAEPATPHSKKLFGNLPYQCTLLILALDAVVLLSYRCGVGKPSHWRLREHTSTTQLAPGVLTLRADDGARWTSRWCFGRRSRISNQPSATEMVIPFQQSTEGLSIARRVAATYRQDSRYNWSWRMETGVVVDEQHADVVLKVLEFRHSSAKVTSCYFILPGHGFAVVQVPQLHEAQKVDDSLEEGHLVSER
ncbi:hypothetical protein PR048_021295 [Dryococelus australis]|uniref:Uncharacterized protein n=1 Tax=Dryococelus australis TaxID=614101 RepID=A0ABQ9GXY2_9NEOP|nr:hypothetical protein PR048_021295 [Dryococelus australis]